MRNQFRFAVRPSSRYPGAPNFGMTFAPNLMGAQAGHGFSENSADRVRWLQRSLNRALGLQLQVNGVMGLRTRKALREFQRRRGLPVDGILSSQTEQALIAASGERASAGVPPARFRSLFDSQARRRGPSTRTAFRSRSPFSSEAESFGEYEGEAETRGPAKPNCRKDYCGPEYVRWVQRSLNRILGLRLAEDRDTGPATISAIRTFQKKHGLTADGSVGPLTEQALAAAGAGQPPPAKEMPCGATSAKDLIKLLRKYGSDLPLEFLLAWIEGESGFRIDSSTYLCERGYFQIHPDQSKRLRLQPRAN